MARWFWPLLAIGCAENPTIEEEQNALLIADPNAREWIVEFDSVQAEEAVADDPDLVGLRTDAEEVLEVRRQEYASQLADILNADPRVVLLDAYDNLPMAHVQGPNSAYRNKLLSLPHVVAVHPIRKYEMMDAESGPIVQAPLAASRGRTGAGTAVAVLDTGANYGHADLGACSSPGGNCPVAYAADFTPSNDNSVDDNGHGTNVAAIVRSVAPGTKILALDVFRTDGYAYNTDIISAINWVIGSRSTYNTRAINLSLGGGYYTSGCSADSFATPVNNARNAGMVIAIASGNNGWNNAVASPGCVPNALTVGATYDANVGGLNWGVCTDYTTSADKVTCFANSASMVDVVAPGALIWAGGYNMGGTSQATPHVAGAAAVIAAQFPWEAIGTWEYRITGRGPMVTDAKNGMSFRRLDLGAGLGLTGDTTAPTGTIAVNNGDAYTGSNVVTVSASPSDANGIESICINTTGVCDAWEPMQWSFNVDVGNTQGTKTVYVWFKDPGGNVSAMASDAIVLDNVAPTGTISINNGASYTGSSAVQVAVSGNDANGVSQMCVNTSNVCDAWEAYATSVNITLGTGSSNPTVYAWLKDAAGNISAEISDSISMDNVAPTGTISINAGASYATTSAVQVTLNGSDTNGLAQICVHTANVCDAWENVASVVNIDVGSNPGTKTVYAWFKDTAGNISAVATDTIVLDNVLPTGTISVNAGATYTNASAVQVGISASDTNGISQICVHTTNVCDAWEGVVGSVNLDLGTVAGTKTVYAWFKDAAGNVSSAATDTIVLDNAAPTGTISINADAQFTTSTAVQVGVNASDDNALSQICVHTANVCDVWESPASTIYLDFGAGSGTKTVYAWFKDAAGNVSAAVTDTIVLDNTAPTGTIVIDSGNTYTADSAVDVTVSGSDDQGVSAICVNTSAICDAWENPASVVSINVGSGSGNRTVYAWFKDAAGNVSAAATDGIALDDVAPGVPTVTASAEAGVLSLTWSTPADDFSGIYGYKVGVGGAPVPCTMAKYTNSHHHSINPNVDVYWSVCAVDNAGNVSALAQGISHWHLDVQPPTGTISMPSTSKEMLVSIKLAATDDEGVTQMCLSEGATCTKWIAYRTRSSWKFSGTGTKALNVVFRDATGNVSAVATAGVVIGN